MKTKKAKVISMIVCVAFCLIGVIIYAHTVSMYKIASTLASKADKSVQTIEKNDSIMLVKYSDDINKQTVNAETLKNINESVTVEIQNKVSSEKATIAERLLYNQKKAQEEAQQTQRSLIDELESCPRIDYIPHVAMEGLVGRLYIPSVGISVNCYNSYLQDVCDAVDSANLMKSGNGGMWCGDHCYQTFRTLPNVQIGDYAYIVTSSGTVRLKCVATLTGHNYGHGITDENGVYVDDSRYSVTAYTCRGCSENVWIREFNIA